MERQITPITRNILTQVYLLVFVSEANRVCTSGGDAAPAVALSSLLVACLSCVNTWSVAEACLVFPPVPGPSGQRSVLPRPLPE